MITDFGIARSGDDPGVTQVGAVVGTPRYMAPEQLAGREVDARADLFSLGVMLFELATGTRPWAGDNAIAIAVAQATQPPRHARRAPTAAAGVRRDRRARASQLDAERSAGERRQSPSVATAIASRDRAQVTTPAVAAPECRGDAAQPHAAATARRRDRRPRPTTALAVLPFACAPGRRVPRRRRARGSHRHAVDDAGHARASRRRRARRAPTPDPRELGRAARGRSRRRRLAAAHAERACASRARLIGVADGFQIWAHRTDCAEAEILAVAETLAPRHRDGAVDARDRRDAADRSARGRALPARTRRAAPVLGRPRAGRRRSCSSRPPSIAPTSAPIARRARVSRRVQAWVMRGEPELVRRVRSARSRARPRRPGIGEAYLASAQFKFNRGEHRARAQRPRHRARARADVGAGARARRRGSSSRSSAPSEARHHFETAIAPRSGTRARSSTCDLARLDALEGWLGPRRSRASPRCSPIPTSPSLSWARSSRHASPAGAETSTR